MGERQGYKIPCFVYSIEEMMIASNVKRHVKGS